MTNDDTNETNPYLRWRREHPVGTLDPEVEILIRQWQAVTWRDFECFAMFDDVIDPWLKGQKSPLPDLVEYITGYGYSRIVTGRWKKLPIDIPSEDLADWDKNSSLAATIEQLGDYEGGVAGGILEMLHADQDKVLTLVKLQLAELYEELAILTTQPIAEFTPTQWEYEDLGMDYTGWEIEELDRIFVIYEKLFCFQRGLKDSKWLMLHDDNPDFHLPNQGFYDALNSIDADELHTNLSKAEPRLREILDFWAHTIIKHTGKPYHRPYDRDGAAPKEFWWRHKKPDTK
jgi:hypothetical protein